jgi:hypothetical protein
MFIRCLALLCIALLISPPAGAVLRGSASTGGQAPDVWNPLKLGAGGVVSGMDIAADGTKVIRTDTYGAYWFNAASNCGNAVTTGCWQQMVTMTSMPAGDAGVGVVRTSTPGVYAIGIAASDTNHFYMIFNGYVYSSTNRGTTWRRGALAQDVSADPNDHFRGYNQKLAVDPVNENVVFVGTPSAGISFSADAGATWTKIPTDSIAAATGGAGYVIAFDPGSSVIGGKTQGIYVSSQGHGVYHSTNGGSGWTLTTSTPTTHQNMNVDAAGNVWLIDNVSGSGCGALNKYDGRWANVLSSSNCLVASAVNPAAPTRIYAIQSFTGKLFISTNTGSSFGSAASNGAVVAHDVPWLGAQMALLSNNIGPASYLAFDPSRPNMLYTSTGLAVMVTNPPSSAKAVTWTSESAGIEQLVGNWVVSPNTPGSKPVVGVWDQGQFLGGTTAYPSVHIGASGTNIPSGWSVDWASSAPSTIVSLNTTLSGTGPAACPSVTSTDTSSISSDGGLTGAMFASPPVCNGIGIRGGGIAASTPTNICAVGTDNGRNSNKLICTQNGGTSWTAATYSGIAPNAAGATGWGANYFYWTQRLIADRGAANTFYIYNDGGGVAGAAGIWKSSNGGVNWSLAHSGAFKNSQGSSQMRAVPGQTGNFYYTSGVQGGPHPSSNLLYECTDSDKLTCTGVSNVKEVWSVGFGLHAPGQSYPAIYIVGWVNQGLGYTYGVWRSDDRHATWTQIGDGFPMGSFDQITTIEGDNNEYGTCYIGFHGSGFAYGKLNFLLKRDLSPASDDNDPMWLEKAT